MTAPSMMSMSNTAALVAMSLTAGSGCGDNSSLPPPPPVVTGAGHSSSIAMSGDGDALYVVDADGDSIAIVDVNARSLVGNVALGTPATANGDFVPTVMPRALVVGPDGTIYVTGMRSGSLYAIDPHSRAITRSAHVCSEPVGVALNHDGSEIYVACSQDAQIAVVDPSLAPIASIAVSPEPWAMSWSADGTQLFVTHLLGPGLTSIDPNDHSTRGVEIPDTPSRGDDARLAHGEVRGLYDVVVRPHSHELWIPHLLLGTDTIQPDLDFETTVFPSVSVVRDDSGYRNTMSIDVAAIPGNDGSFADIVSGPHAIAFTSDGDLAIVVDQNSQDLLAVDASRQAEVGLLRPLPGRMPDGIVIASDDSTAFVLQRNTRDLAVVSIQRDTASTQLVTTGTIPLATAADPMPADIREGQHLFYSANSDELPITFNHWVACASCHIEGRSDGVTWKFEQGPRDTPTNAGGMLGTGFLFRTADRTKVQDYFLTINLEQGGAFDPGQHAAELDAIAAFVNHGIPAPIPPTTDPAKVAMGKAVFERTDVGCASCHGGPKLTDSGAGNPTLDLGGAIMLHDVGTCATFGYPDLDHDDVEGDPRAACMFDTPSLVGVASSPPYFHDGRARSLRAALELTRGKMGDISPLSDAELDALVEYLRSL